jgi:hypothetical protein
MDMQFENVYPIIKFADQQEDSRLSDTSRDSQVNHERPSHLEVTI